MAPEESEVSLPYFESDSSCPTTPAAGDHAPWVNLQASGRSHFEVVDHLNAGPGSPQEDEPGLHGHGCGEHDIEDGMERYIGHGRRKFSVAHFNHLKGTGAHPQKPEAAGLHGHSKEMDNCSDGMPWCIGHGRRKVIDHVKDHLWEEESAPGGHGHKLEDGFDCGLERVIGHGRRKVKVNHRSGWPGPMHPEDMPAGMSSRDIEVVRRPRNPTCGKKPSFRG